MNANESTCERCHGDLTASPSPYLCARCWSAEQAALADILTEEEERELDADDRRQREAEDRPECRRHVRPW